MKDLLTSLLANVLSLPNAWDVQGSKHHNMPLVGKLDYEYCLLVGLERPENEQKLFTLSLFNSDPKSVSSGKDLQPIITIRAREWDTIEEIADGWLQSKADPDMGTFLQVKRSFDNELVQPKTLRMSQPQPA